MDSTSNGSDNVFAYKAGVGMTYRFTEQTAGDLGCEYLGGVATDLATSVNGHSVVASVRFKFYPASSPRWPSLAKPFPDKGFTRISHLQSFGPDTQTTHYVFDFPSLFF